MSLSNPRIFFGIHSFTPYSRTTGLPYGTVLVLGSSTFSLEGELVELRGGSAKYPFAIEEANITADLTIAPKEYPNFLYELFLGKAVTDNSAETGGSVTSIVDVNGTTVVGATGILSATIKSGQTATLKFARYVVKAASATTVDVYALSNVDFARGTDLDFVDDTLKITSSPLTITTSAAVEIPGTGIELTGGGGTIGMTTGDTATFETRPINTDSIDVVIGASTNTFPEFGALVVAQQRGSGEMVELNIFRCKAAGLPMSFSEKEFSEAEITAKAFYDSAKGGVFSIRTVVPS